MEKSIKIMIKKETAIESHKLCIALGCELGFDNVFAMYLAGFMCKPRTSEEIVLKIKTRLNLDENGVSKVHKFIYDVLNQNVESFYDFQHLLPQGYDDIGGDLNKQTFSYNELATLFAKRAVCGTNTSNILSLFCRMVSDTEIRKVLYEKCIKRFNLELETSEEAVKSAPSKKPAETELILCIYRMILYRLKASLIL